jgi:2-oxo-4-hydroxy-4-carboxy-5-ureidoimidazoline decarboxylase
VTRLAAFNALSADQAATLLRPCLGVDRWVTTVVAGRPYDSVDHLVAAARTAAHPFTGAELEDALSHHPRIGERAAGASAEADLSRSEQAGLSIDGDVQAQLAEGNRAYEDRFGRVFLIRAAGRTSEEILAELRTRLDNDVETEDEVVADQLRQIAVVRLTGVVSP